MLGIVKSFGGVHALRGACLEGCVGETHALIGENGAGKSTLVKVLSGAVLPSGSRARRPRFGWWHPAMRGAGIGTVFQELSLIPDLSVASNLLYAIERAVRRPGRIDRRAAIARRRPGSRSRGRRHRRRAQRSAS